MTLAWLWVDWVALIGIWVPITMLEVVSSSSSSSRIRIRDTLSIQMVDLQEDTLDILLGIIGIQAEMEDTLVIMGTQVVTIVVIMEVQTGTITPVGDVHPLLLPIMAGTMRGMIVVIGIVVNLEIVAQVGIQVNEIIHPPTQAIMTAVMEVVIMGIMVVDVHLLPQDTIIMMIDTMIITLSVIILIITRDLKGMPGLPVL